MLKNDESFTRSIDSLGLAVEITRRGFIRSTLGITGFSALGWAGKSADVPFVILEDAKGLLVTDTTRCVGCRRCELACTEYNDGRAQPVLARIKVARNYNYGPAGPRGGFGRSEGEFGNLRMVQDSCLQCPHPVPCSVACPNDAIIADEMTGARRVDLKKCKGCRLCLQACPWDMIVFDNQAKKATKCFLCDGRPECVAACPTLALRYVPWRDLTRNVPIRRAVLPALGDKKAAGCRKCHG